MHRDIYTALVTLVVITIMSLTAVGLGDTHKTEASHVPITEDESYEVEIEEYTKWIRRSSKSLRRKIDTLDEDPILEFEVPVLFGVTLGDITPNFGDPRGGGTRSHEGLDMLAPLGTPVVSPTDAVVVRTGKGSSAGMYVYTANPGDETFVYMHLRDTADIKSGDVLDAGDLIGFVGNSGNANGVSHLHFEVRDDEGPTDPYQRIQDEYDLNEKIRLLETIFDDVRNDRELAEFLVETYSGIFLLAEGEGIDLPEAISKELGDADLGVSVDEILENLERGDEGSDVVVLQTHLILQNVGPQSLRLAEVGATGYFGPLTEAALTEFQLVVGVTPANGYFGPKTRAKLQPKAKSDIVSKTTKGDLPTKDRPIALGHISTLIPSDLGIGARGLEVKVLQLFLMVNNSGPAAGELFAAGSTGYFGPLTSAAFYEYQKAHGIPQTGIYDSATRAYMRENE